MRRLDLVAAGWGGLAAAIGLLATSGRDWPLRLAVTAASFALGGFLAAVRAEARRPKHALAAVVVAYLIDVAFVTAARAVEAGGGPDAPALAPEGSRSWALAAAWAVAFALLGGLVANSWLRPAGQRRRG